jgi:hypothetical protein
VQDICDVHYLRCGYSRRPWLVKERKEGRKKKEMIWMCNRGSVRMGREREKEIAQSGAKA